MAQYKSVQWSEGLVPTPSSFPLAPPPRVDDHGVVSGVPLPEFLISPSSVSFSKYKHILFFSPLFHITGRNYMFCSVTCFFSPQYDVS